MSVSPGVHFRNLGKIVWNKVPPCLCSKDVQKYGWSWIRLSPEGIVGSQLGLQSPEGLTGLKDLALCSRIGWLVVLSSSLLLTGGFSSCHRGLSPELAAHSEGLAEREKESTQDRGHSLFITVSLGN